MKYSALIIDIKNSKKMNEEVRNKYQLKLKKSIDILNKLLKDKLKYRVVFSLGDSVQGLFYDLNDAYGYFDLLKNLSYPLELSGGIGYGEVYVDLESFDSNTQDGPAYHNARLALDICKEENLEIVVVDYRNDIYVNESLRVIKSLESKGSRKRKDIANLVNLLYPFYIKHINKEMYYQEITTFILSNVSSYDKINIDIFNIDKLLKLDMDTSNQIKNILPATVLPQSLSLIIGEVVDTTRENIRQMIEVGEMNQIRNLKNVVYRILKMKGL